MGHFEIKAISKVMKGKIKQKKQFYTNKGLVLELVSELMLVSDAVPGSKAVLLSEASVRRFWC